MVQQVELCLTAQSVNEGSVGEHTVLILRVAELSEQLLDIILGDLISKIGKKILKLSQHHGSVVIFVIKSQQLNEVVVVSRGLGGFGSCLDFSNNIIELGKLLAFLISLSESNTHLKYPVLYELTKLGCIYRCLPSLWCSCQGRT